MKKILFDFLPFQDFNINGGALYAKIILYSLCEKKDISLIGICSDVNKINKKILLFAEKKGIKIITINKSLSEFVKDNNIDLFFISIAQRYNAYDLTSLSCPIYIVCHDLFDFSMYNTRVANDYDRTLLNYKISKKRMLFLRCIGRKFKSILREKTIFGLRKKPKNVIKMLGYSYFEKLIKQENVTVITVSNYSKAAIHYYFQDIKNEIIVLYPPEIKKEADESIVLPTNKPYFLIMSANRPSKNFFLFYRTFERWNRSYGNKFSAVIIGIDSIDLEDCYCYNKISDSQMAYLIKNCYALLYPSLAEGFGHPPIEAMKYGKPVLAAYDTSIPEICLDGALFFNPFYEEDLFHKQTMLIENYDGIKSKTLNRYKEVSKKQQDDFDELINILTK